MKVLRIPPPISEQFVAEHHRFWQYVEVKLASDCWPWINATRRGYGTFTVSGGQLGFTRRRSVYAHRVAFFLTHGWWPQLVRHSCDNPVCCNPGHLLQGTPKSNMADKYERGRANHPKGHSSARSNVSPEVVAAIRESYPARSQSSIARDYGISQASVSRIVRGVRY